MSLRLRKGHLQITPKYDYHWEWENWAATPTTSFKDWWEKSTSGVEEECQTRRQARSSRENCPL